MRLALLLAVASVAGAGLVAAGEPAAAVTPGVFKLRAPAPGDLAVGVVKMHTSRKSAIALAERPFQIRLAKAVPGLVVLTAVHTQRNARSVTRTVFFIVANRSKRALAGVDPHDGAFIYLAFFMTGVYVGDDPIFEEHNSLTELVAELNESVLTATAAQRKQEAKALTDLYTSPAASSANDILGDPNLDTGWYDDGHSFGWKEKAPVAKAIIKDAWRDLTVPQGATLVSEEVARVNAEIDAASGQAPPKQQLFAYAFNDLSISFDGPDVPDVGRTHVTVTFLGAGCGTSQASDWKGTYQVTSLGSPLNLAWGAGLTSGVASPVYTWSYRQGGPTGPVLGDVKLSLILIAGSPPTIGIRWSKDGDIANVAVHTDMPVTAKPVAAC